MFKDFFRKSYENLNLITLSRESLLHNLYLFQKLHPNKKTAPVLKGNAYGHGLLPVARLLDTEGCPFFIVDSLYEAYELKKAKICTEILVLGYNFPHNLHKRLPFEFTASDLSSLKNLLELELPFHLEVETGMNRLGLREEDFLEAAALISKNPKLFRGLFTHLMTADEVDSPWLTQQKDRFTKALDYLVARGFKPEWIHLSNTAGAQKPIVLEENLLRIGLGLYGINPYCPEDPAHQKLQDLQPVLTLHSTLIAVHELKPGGSLSYGATYTADRLCKIGILPFGYFEGLPRTLSNKGYVFYQGKRCPIRGRVNMNHTFIDVTEVDAQLGEKVEIPIADLAPLAGTIPYEMLSRLSPTIRRVVA